MTGRSRPFPPPVGQPWDEHISPSFIIRLLRDNNGRLPMITVWNGTGTPESWAYAVMKVRDCINSHYCHYDNERRATINRVLILEPQFLR